jgi:HTH-type transcriptional regulator/antitoxin HigA
MGMLNAKWVQHPGFYIKEELEARGWSQRDLAYILGCPEQAVNLIVTGKRGISPEMAKALGEAFDVGAEFFANLQNAYDLSRAREPDPGVSSRANLQKVYPVREMIKRGWLEDTDAAMLEVQIAKFFEVASLEQVPYLAHAAKKGQYPEKVPPVQLAWLFRVKQIARSLIVPKYSERALSQAVPKLQHLLSAPEEVRHVARILAECGIRFIIVETLPQAKIDGACFWLNADSPVIGISFRYDRIDNFWFVLRHEIEHILQRYVYSGMVIDTDLEGDRAGIDNSLPEEERRANMAAGDFCVPKNEMDSFVLRKQPFFSERDVLAFARHMQIHPGIVVGQIHMRTRRYELLRKYLVKVRQLLLHGSIIDGWGQVAPVSL